MKKTYTNSAYKDFPSRKLVKKEKVSVLLAFIIKRLCQKLKG